MNNEHTETTAQDRHFSQREIRAEMAGGESGATAVMKLAGYAAVWDEESTIANLWREVFRRGAFSASLAAGADVTCLVNHDVSKILGRTTSGTLTVAEDDKGLRFECALPDTTAARDIFESVKRGDVAGCSFEFRATKQTWHEQAGQLDLREILAAEISDVTIATYPYYKGTEVSTRSRAAYDAELERRREQEAAARARVLQLAKVD